MAKVKKNKVKQKPANRKDWEANHWLIYDAYLQEFESTGRAPTQTRLAEVTKLNRSTIASHMQGTKLEHLIPSVKMRTMRVLHGLAKRAEEGYAAEVKLWMQLVESWTERNQLINLNADLSNLTSEQLQRIRDGEPIEKVLQG